MTTEIIETKVLQIWVMEAEPRKYEPRNNTVKFFRDELGGTWAKFTPSDLPNSRELVYNKDYVLKCVYYAKP